MCWFVTTEIRLRNQNCNCLVVKEGTKYVCMSVYVSKQVKIKLVLNEIQLDSLSDG